MIPSTDYSYIGSGSILIREYGSAAPLVTLGNCSALSLSPKEDVKTLLDYTQPGGNQRAEVRRVTGVDLSLTFHDFSASQFAMGLRAQATSATAGTVTDEAVVAYKGGYAALAKIADAITTVKAYSGSPNYTAGTDYELRDGMLYIPDTSTIANPTGGAANLKVTYSYKAQAKVEALISSNKQYELVFIGLNEAQSGKRVRVRCFKVSGGTIKDLALIGQDFASGEVSGSLLPDTTRVGSGLSQYFTWENEA